MKVEWDIHQFRIWLFDVRFFSEELRQFFAGDESIFHVVVQHIKAAVFLALRHWIKYDKSVNVN